MGNSNSNSMDETQGELPTGHFWNGSKAQQCFMYNRSKSVQTVGSRGDDVICGSFFQISFKFYLCVPSSRRVNHYLAKSVIIEHWVGLDAAERSYPGVQKATGDRCSASLSLARPLQPVAPPEPVGVPDSAPVSPPVDTQAAAYSTADRL